MERVPDDIVSFSVFYAASRVIPTKLGRTMTEEERQAFAAAVMAHFKRAGWTVWKEPYQSRHTP